MFNIYKNDMKYLLIPFLLFLVACEQSNTPSELKTDVINIEMGGLYGKTQTTIGDAYITNKDNSNEFTYTVFENGCHTEYHEIKAYTDFVLGADDEWYYIGNMDFRINKNPVNNNVYYGYAYQQVEDGWELTKGDITITYREDLKTITYFNTKNLTLWGYAW
jgi:hypothetical protein